MFFPLEKILLVLLLPPASLLALIGAGLLVINRRRRAGTVLIVLGAALLYLLSIHPVADLLLRPLEAAYPPPVSSEIKADAVVVLSGGATNLSWLRIEPQPSDASLQRLITGIRLAGALRLPLVITGGSGETSPAAPREAEAMAAVARGLGFPEKKLMIESQSRNTLENASAVAGMLQGRRIVLVTSAFHLKRSVAMFRRQGFQVIPMPSHYHIPARIFSLTSLIPRAEVLGNSSLALSEYLSLAWYGMRGKL